MARTLTIKGRLASIHKKMEVTDDEDGEVLYRVSAKAVSITHRTYVTDAKTGEQIAEIHSKPVSIHHIYYVDMTNGPHFQLSTEFFHIKTVKNIPELGWQLRGNIMNFNFTVVDQKTGEELALGHRRLMSLHRIYDLEVLDESHLDELVCIFIVLKRMIDIRRKQEALSDTTTMSS